MIDETILICLFVLVTGACIGSFLNVVALRALSGESIVFPSSKCPLCNEPIKWYDNIPVLSYLFTFRGKCRNCGGKVSVQYPIVEALTSILFLLIFSLKIGKYGFADDLRSGCPVYFKLLSVRKRLFLKVMNLNSRSHLFVNLLLI